MMRLVVHAGDGVALEAVSAEASAVVLHINAAGELVFDDETTIAPPCTIKVEYAAIFRPPP